MIDLGLARISRLLALLGNPHLAGWKAVHVAGTNGKGSVCAYIASCLTAARVPSGRFTSPHLAYKWDCIEVNGEPVRQALFRDVEAHVMDTSRTNGVDATEFEILTATAFEIFRREQIEVAVVEVGLGGRLDATNVLSNVLVSVITKIGLDHQGFLGNDLAEIAAHKAGILKPGVPAVFDATNAEPVRRTVSHTAREVGSPLVAASASHTFGRGVGAKLRPGDVPLLGSYQTANVACALAALDIAATQLPVLTPTVVAKGIRATRWPGRLQWMEVPGQLDQGRPRCILLDGAHNAQAATLLGEYVDGTVRGKNEGPVAYVLAFSQGKDLGDILAHLLRDGDIVVATTFGEVDGMPWIRPTAAEDVGAAASQFTPNVTIEPDLGRALALPSPHGVPTVVAGSLYLVGDVVRRLSPPPL